MKKIFSIILSLVFVASQFAIVSAAEDTATKATLPLVMSGKITDESETAIKVTNYKGDQSVILNITDSTYIVDAVKGTYTLLKDRIDDNIIAYYGPEQTKSLPAKSNAVAIICNMPQDYSPPSYAKVEAIEQGTDQIKATINNGSMIVTLNKDTALSPYKTKNIVALGNIKVGTSLLLWLPDVMTMIYPAQVTATKAVLLGTDASVETTVDKKSTTPLLMSGKITSESATAIAVTNYKGDQTVILNITDSTYIVDAVKGSYALLKDRISDSIIVYYGPEQTKSLPAKSNAVAIICNMPQDFKAPVYAKVEALVQGTDQIKIAINDGSMFVTLNKDTALSPYKTKNIVALGNIKVGTSLLLWLPNVTTMIYPAQVTATKAAILGTDATAIIKVDKKDLTLASLPANDANMIPLRSVAEAYGYTVTWHANEKAIDIAIDDQVYSLAVNKNMYGDIELESAPIIGKDELTYVPASFFEKILNLSVNADDNTTTFNK